MEDKPTKSLALPIAAGVLVGSAVYDLLRAIWSQVFRVANIIDWDWTMRMGDRIRFDCGGCVSVFVVAVLAIVVAFGLIKISQK